MKLLILSTAILFTFFSCKTKKATTQIGTIDNTSWGIVTLGTQTPKSTQTLIFKGAKVTGKGACNGYGANVKIGEGNTILFSDIFATKMACPNLKEESFFFKMLRKTTSYKLKKEELSFYSIDNKLLVKLKKI